MHTAEIMKNWMHHIHDDSIKVMYKAEHLMHESAFWAIALTFLFMAVSIALLLIYGKDANPSELTMPFPYYGGY